MIVNTAKDYNEYILDFVKTAVQMNIEKDYYKQNYPKIFDYVYKPIEKEYDRHYDQYLHMHNGLLTLTENELDNVDELNFNSFEISSSYIHKSIYIETRESLNLLNDMMSITFAMLKNLIDVNIPSNILKELINTPIYTQIKFTNGVLKRNNAHIRFVQYETFIKNNNQKTKDVALMLFERVDVIQKHMWFISKVFDVDSIKMMRSCPNLSLSGKLYIRFPEDMKYN